MNFTKAEEIADTSFRSPHVVILGAGASRAACPEGDANRRPLPVMADFVDLLGLGELLPVEYKDLDFETAYSQLAGDPTADSLREQIDELVYRYFSSLKLPGPPNVYDHVVLSLRPKDVIATFNWDPFLIQAIQRSYKIGYQPPRALFLHGGVMTGFCKKDATIGVNGYRCSRCGMPFLRSRLLYPVAKKNYQQDPMIAGEWDDLGKALKAAFMVTIFGYSAPASDRGAIDLLSRAWGTPEERQFEQIEIIDIRPKRELAETWSAFIHTHHYRLHRSFYDSFLGQHPRRSGEAFRQQFMEGRWPESNPLPSTLDRPALWDWLTPLLDEEGDRALASHHRP